MRRFLTLLAFFASALALSAQDLNSVRASMTDRLPLVVQLLRKEVVGENNQGFLTIRGKPSEDMAKVISAENADRQALYGLLAKRESLKPEEVGRAQARQLAKLSAKGFWIQDEEGEWAQKP